MMDNGAAMRSLCALDPDLHVSALEFELGDIFLDQEFNQLFQLFNVV